VVIVVNKIIAIACVTGATGMVGSKIVQHLLAHGYQVRVLTRKTNYHDSKVTVFRGGLEDEEVLKRFLKDANLLFHCAAEIHDESKMWATNVKGTENLLNCTRDNNIQYLCYISTCVVVGKTDQIKVTENTPCNPQDIYEKSKCTAEQMVAQGIDGCRVIILRPTEIFDESRPGALELPMRNSWMDRIKLFIKGGECIHLIHADNVAAAAIYFISYPFEKTQCYFVSCDEDPLNTLAGLWAFYDTIKNGRNSENIIPKRHLPIIIPHLLRQIWRGKGNKGNVKYSSEKLLSTGFVFPLGLDSAIKKVILEKGAKNYKNTEC